jgi:hypothetical protein
MEGYNHDVHRKILLQKMVDTKVRVEGKVTWVEKEDGMVLGQE